MCGNGAGAISFPGGESREAFIRRCASGFQRMCTGLQQAQTNSGTENKKGPVRAAAIVHGGTIMALLSSYGTRGCQKGYFDYQAANGRGYLCQIGGWKKDAVLWSRKETERNDEIWIKEAVEI